MGYRIYKQPASVIYHAAQGDKSSIERIINAYDDYMNVKLCQEINENKSFTFSKEDIGVTFGDNYGN